jgi:hypothetical protein
MGAKNGSWMNTKEQAKNLAAWAKHQLEQDRRREAQRAKATKSLDTYVKRLRARG